MTGCFNQKRAEHDVHTFDPTAGMGDAMGMQDEAQTARQTPASPS